MAFALIFVLVISLPYSSSYAQEDSDQGAIGELLQDTRDAFVETWDAIKSDSKAVGEFATEKSSDAWDATKDGASAVSETSGEIWDDTKEASSEALDATKSASKSAADYTVEKSSEAWDATKSASKSAAEYTSEKYDQAKESLLGENENDVVVEEKSTEGTATE